MTLLPTPEPGRDAALDFVSEHLEGLFCDDVRGSQRFSGGQAAAEDALAAFDVTGYAANRNEVYPQPRRGASGLSPYVRHGLLSLPEVWAHVEGGPTRDVAKFRNELLWQEFARHWYARLGSRTAQGVHNERPVTTPWDGDWNRSLACLELSVGELEDDGWLVNQTRMWLASHLTVRLGGAWQQGEDYFFRHLLDGSRAANRLGWQWTSGVGSTKAYGFSRWQVEERAPGLCASCELVHHCPIEDWPTEVALRPKEKPVELRRGAGDDGGPTEPLVTATPDAVWLTAESLGTEEPALVAHPDLPVVFVFDQPLLTKLQLSSKRLVFLTETLAELGRTRTLQVHLGRPADAVSDRRVATTFAPVPGFQRLAALVEPAVVHPWPWLRPPTAGSVMSFSAWLKANG